MRVIENNAFTAKIENKGLAYMEQKQTNRYCSREHLRDGIEVFYFKEHLEQTKLLLGNLPSTSEQKLLPC